MVAREHLRSDALSDRQGAPARGRRWAPAIVDLAVATPAFIDVTYVGLEALPGPGEERFARDLLVSPGGGAITAIGAARLGLATALVARVGSDGPGALVARELERMGVALPAERTDRTPV